MKRYLYGLGILAVAGCFLFGARPDATADALEAAELPDSILAVVKTAPVKQMTEKAVAVARQFQPGPQTESLPFVMGALLGDPMLQGISSTANAGLVLLAGGDEPAAVLVLSLPEESPWRQTLPGFGLKLRQAEGWTFAAREDAHLAAIEGLEKAAIVAVSSRRSYDIEAALNPTALAGKAGQFREGLLAQVDDELRPLLDSLWKAGEGEVNAIRFLSTGIDLSATEIAYAFQLAARADTPLARALDQPPASEIPYASHIPAGGPFLFLGAIDLNPIIGYAEHLLAQIETTLEANVRDGMAKVLANLRYFAEKSDGASAGYFGIEGMQPRFLQASGAKFEQAELLEYMNRSAELMKVFEKIGGDAVRTTYEIIPEHMTVDDIPVHLLRSGMRFERPGDAEINDLGDETQQELYHALVDGVLLTGTDAGRLGDMVRSVRDKKTVAGSIAEKVRLRPEESFRFNIDLVDYFGGIVGGIMMFDEQASSRLAELKARNLPDATGWVSARDGTFRSRVAIPVETVAEVFKLFQNQMPGEQAPSAY